MFSSGCMPTVTWCLCCSRRPTASTRPACAETSGSRAAAQEAATAPLHTRRTSWRSGCIIIISCLFCFVFISHVWCSERGSKRKKQEPDCWLVVILFYHVNLLFCHCFFLSRCSVCGVFCDSLPLPVIFISRILLMLSGLPCYGPQLSPHKLSTSSLQQIQIEEQEGQRRWPHLPASAGGDG